MNIIAGLLSIVLIAVCFWSVLCRLAQIALSAETAGAAAQLIALGSGLILTALAMIKGWDGTLPVLAGLTFYLLFGARRWGPPSSRDGQSVDSLFAQGERR